MKSIRKRAATAEYIKHMRDHFVKHGGKALQHTKGTTSLRYYVGDTSLHIPADTKQGSTTAAVTNHASVNKREKKAQRKAKVKAKKKMMLR
jgi:hypothetical protein